MSPQFQEVGRSLCSIADTKQANNHVRSTTQRLGNKTNPLRSLGRITTCAWATAEVHHPLHEWITVKATIDTVSFLSFVDKSTAHLTL